MIRKLFLRQAAFGATPSTEALAASGASQLEHPLSADELAQVNKDTRDVLATFRSVRCFFLLIPSHF